MRVFIIGILFSAFVASAAEYGYFYRNDTNGWSSSTPIELNDGDRFVLINSDGDTDIINSYPLTEYKRGADFILDNGTTLTIDLLDSRNSQDSDARYYERDYPPENLRTIVYNGTITLADDQPGSHISYKIIRANEEEGGSKFTASLNSDGSRLAIGSKTPGSNAVTRVYEFNGSSWNQLGEDVE
jgi:hypothetical protein